MKKILLMLSLALLCCCTKQKAGRVEGSDMTLQYAKGFSVKERADGVRFLTVSDPQKGDAADTKHFALVPRGKRTDLCRRATSRLACPSTTAS